MKRSRWYYKAPFPVIKTITFDGTAGLGAIGAFNLFTLTGRVLIVSYEAFCTVDIGVDAGAGVASMQMGVEGDTDLFVPTTQADAIDANEHWVSATPTAKGIALPAPCKDVVISADIKGEVTSTGTQKVNAGTLVVTVYYVPSTVDGKLEAA